MVMGPRNKEKTMNIDLSGNNIEQSISIKLLGVEVESSLILTNISVNFVKGQTNKQDC